MLLFLKPVALSAKRVNLVQHSFKQCVGRRRGYPGPLQLPDLAALPLDLNPHPFDFAPDMLDVRHGPDPLKSGCIRERNKNEMQAARFSG